MHGLASSEGKIKAYEVRNLPSLLSPKLTTSQCVLADGTIATVTASGRYSDLYWALQGGGSNFALVTRFDLQTFPLPSALRAEARIVRAPTTKDLYLNTLLDFTLNGDIDPHAAVIPVIRWEPKDTTPSYESTILYNGTAATSTSPHCRLL
jgi:hypothetical protein